MTPERAWKLSHQTATVALAGGPYTEAELHQRIVRLFAEVLLNEDWRILPEDREEEKPELFEGQMGLEL